MSVLPVYVIGRDPFEPHIKGVDEERSQLCETIRQVARGIATMIGFGYPAEYILTARFVFRRPQGRTPKSIVRHWVSMSETPVRAVLFGRLHRFAVDETGAIYHQRHFGDEGTTESMNRTVWCPLNLEKCHLQTDVLMGYLLQDLRGLTGPQQPSWPVMTF